jgi:hypothetical protein
MHPVHRRTQPQLFELAVLQRRLLLAAVIEQEDRSQP